MPRYNTLLVQFEPYGFSTARAASFVNIFKIFDTEAEACQAIIHVLSTQFGFLNPVEVYSHLLVEIDDCPSIEEIQADLNAVATIADLNAAIVKYDFSESRDYYWTYKIDEIRDL